jgi:hypothetical protein
MKLRGWIVDVISDPVDTACAPITDKADTGIALQTERVRTGQQTGQFRNDGSVSKRRGAVQQARAVLVVGGQFDEDFTHFGRGHRATEMAAYDLDKVRISSAIFFRKSVPDRLRTPLGTHSGISPTRTRPAVASPCSLE